MSNMTRMILQLSGREGHAGRPGLVDRLHDAGPIGSDRQERLQRAMSDYETAVKRSDEMGREMADARIDAVLDEARDARRAAEAQAVEATRLAPRHGDTGAGVRSARTGFNPHGARQESSTALFRRAIAARQVERAVDAADEGQTIIATNYNPSPRWRTS